ncbi:MAG: hypothetical protein SVU32_03240, partial [Candidatus Nanohaloarchaea archaeon]|nr:hypothetical protein [Candidatus Nanohaloarchaea archaeon]
MERIPDTAVYHTEVLDDDLGTGVRIQCSDGSLYEARQLAEAEIRLYREHGEYTVKVGTDASPGTDAYETTAEFARRLDEAYGTSFEWFL